MTSSDTSGLMPDLAHEIRNPVSTIIALAELVDMDPDSANECSRDLILNAGRIDRLMTDMCTLARASAACANKTPQIIDISDVLRELCEDNPRLQLTPETGSAHVMIAPGDLALALTQILDNATELSEADSLVEVTLTTDNSHAHLTCRNRGHSIPEAILPKLTDPFFKRRCPEEMILHSGLGLTIASVLISGYAGSMQITSECIGQDQAINTVHVTLPLAG